MMPKMRSSKSMLSRNCRHSTIKDVKGLKWRHRSFLEFFAGSRLAETFDAQEQVFRKHARDPRWSWSPFGSQSERWMRKDCIRKSTRLRRGCWRLAQRFFFGRSFRKTGSSFSRSLDELCRWLVHCGTGIRGDNGVTKTTSPWKSFQAPALTDKTAPILASDVRCRSCRSVDSP